ncbi:yidC [Wigglesworthia glossinidia endosymbiont of Glossina brevipalpis]|uniref:Membrane protein insertase YidC n=1 Tax=Wigglesworthia glossinidia brevipalpis TaxID=36870 RepID=YIDC_WIGBR|nr:RecName: Full=Membrane protein insertase YidC; AltName: Full=Foldase YidC; AltName: Full=Membrane integrase YidC; AltName: Full=Membrane protein YidC [Wigglesworthia glossinidia endosymbiont of Glossina brevipalpis]BAC24159.1 yidC [Wigglesworthia glossinidia endosymbiont of Glossina brevipalpis]
MVVQNNFLFIAFIFVTFMMLDAWQSESYDYKSLDKNHIIEKKNIENKNINKEVFSRENYITVITDLFILKINTYGGDIEEASLRTYLSNTKNNLPLKILDRSKNFIYKLKSGFITKNDHDINNLIHIPNFISDKKLYILEDNSDYLQVPLFYNGENGLKYVKNFIFKKNSFSLKINYSIKNTNKDKMEMMFFGQLEQSIKDQEINNGYNFNFHTYRGAAYSSDNNKYKKYDFSEISNDKNLNVITSNGWIAMLQQYFIVAWIPKIENKYKFYTKNIPKDEKVSIGFQSELFSIDQEEEKNIESTLWIGPKLQDKMYEVDANLGLTVDYGWLWFIAQPLLQLLKFIYKYINNWGISIIIITFMVRGIMFPLTKAQYTSMAKMRILQPKIIEIKNKFSNDKKRQSKEMMSLYKKQKVNPLGGCMPLIIQMPIFLALYYMLSGSVELRHAHFVLWINDLSSKDPYYILPIIMGITMFLIQKISPSSISDPVQKKIVSFMPLIFTIFFLWFPSGLVLYYIISNLVTIIQQYIIYKDLKKVGILI